MGLKIVKSAAIAPNRDQSILAGHRAYAENNLELAAQHFLKALEANDRDPELLVQIAVVLFQDNKFDKAVAALRQALILDPYLVSALNAMGVVLQRLDWHAASEIFFRRVLELDPSHPAAKNSLVQAIRLVRETGDTVVPELEYLTQLAKPKEPSLSLCMIVKNEEKFLEGCLQSVQGVVDEIVIVDTGSTDATVEIAERFGAKLVHFPWTGDFAAARNESIDHATGDWILVLDADERLDENTKAKIKPLLRHEDVVGYSLLIESYLGSEIGDGAQLGMIYRLFRNRPDVRYEGIVHEQVSATAQRTGLKSFNTDVKLIHYGYMQTVVDDRDKNQRNLELLERQALNNPEDSYNQFNLGMTYKLLGQLERAESHYAAALRLLKAAEAPHNIPYYANVYYNLADLNRRFKNFETALAYLKEAEALYPNFPDLIFTYGLTYFDQERWTEALDYFERCQRLAGVVHAGGTDPMIATHKSLNAIGLCHAKLGNRSKAIDYLKRAIAAHPKPEAELRTNLGILYLEDQNPSQASLQFVAALEQDAKEIRAWLNLASIAYRAGRFEEALESWAKALELDPSLVEVRVVRAEALLKLGRVIEAQEILLNEVDLQIASHAAMLNLGLTHLLMGQLPEAQAIWDRFPENEECLALSRFGQLLSSRVDVADLPDPRVLIRSWSAVVDLAIAARRETLIQTLLDGLAPFAAAVPGLEIHLGEACLKRDRPELATDLFLRAQQRTPEGAPPYIALGNACLASKNREDAQIMFAMACQLAPEDPYPRRQLALLGGVTAATEGR